MTTQPPPDPSAARATLRVGDSSYRYYALLVMTHADVPGFNSGIKWSAVFNEGAIAVETFSRTESDGWGISEILSIPWQRISGVATGNSFVNGADGVQDLSYLYTNNDPVQYLDLSAITYPFEMTLDVAMERSSGTAQSEGVFGLREPVPTNSFWGFPDAAWVQWWWQANGDVWFRLQDGRGTGGSSAWKSFTGLLTSADQVRIRIRIEADRSMFKVWLAQAEEPSTWDGELVVGSYTPNLRYLVAYAANLNAPGVLTYDEIRIVQGLP